ncbi:MAG: hypothetical protein KIS92_09200 [Planctomycetota bacterium]|nr:hypothetical protein [Planctomycetota bacterium]
MRTTFLLTETLGIAREHEPVRVGVPLPRGSVKAQAPVARAGGSPVQSTVLARWGDGSVKWLLLDLAASCGAGETRRVDVEIENEGPAAAGPVSAEADGTSAKIFSDRLRLNVKTGANGAVELAVNTSGAEALPLKLILGLAGAAPAEARPVACALEAAGPARATVCVRYTIPSGLERPLEAALRFSVSAGSPLLSVQAALTNPNPAVREFLGRWPLGSPGASYLSVFGLKLGAKNGLAAGKYAVDERASFHRPGTDVRIEQESSGGLHWDMRTHLDRHGKIPQRYAGYRVCLDGQHKGSNFRAQPWVEAAAGGLTVGLGIRDFWQNYPVAIDTAAGAPATLEYFSSTFGSGEIELQGGEAKSWEATVALAPAAWDEPESRRLQAACAAPLVALPTAEALESSRAEGPFVRRDDARRPAFERAVVAMIRDPRRNVFTQREVIDEYGWRNFGDLWADNERGCKDAPREAQLVISHYNQEYDWGFGMLYQALRNAGVDDEAAADWWALGRAALRHEADIDTYHCWPREKAQDGVYCGGHFTHTAHGVEAGDAGHRGAPTDKFWNTADWPWGRGGGPESGHYHSRGQWLLYYLTGDARHREIALECTESVAYKIGEDRFPQSDNVGRDSGHSMQILTDAYAATRDEKYLALAAKILARANFKKQWEEKLDKNPHAGDFTNSIYLRECGRLLDALADAGQAPDAPLYRQTLESMTSYLDVIERLGWHGPEAGFSDSVRGDGKPRAPKMQHPSNDSWNFIPTNGWLADAFALASAHVASDERRARYLAIAAAAYDLDQKASQGASRTPVYRNCKVATGFCRGSVVAAALTEK